MSSYISTQDPKKSALLSFPLNSLSNEKRTDGRISPRTTSPTTSASLPYSDDQEWDFFIFLKVEIMKKEQLRLNSLRNQRGTAEFHNLA